MTPKEHKSLARKGAPPDSEEGERSARFKELCLGIEKKSGRAGRGASHRMCHSALRRAAVREDPMLRRYARLCAY